MKSLYPDPANARDLLQQVQTGQSSIQTGMEENNVDVEGPFDQGKSASRDRVEEIADAGERQLMFVVQFRGFQTR